MADGKPIGDWANLIAIPNSACDYVIVKVPRRAYYCPGGPASVDEADLIAALQANDELRTKVLEALGHKPEVEENQKTELRNLHRVRRGEEADYAALRLLRERVSVALGFVAGHVNADVLGAITALQAKLQAAEAELGTLRTKTNNQRRALAESNDGTSRSVAKGSLVKAIKSLADAIPTEGEMLDQSMDRERKLLGRLRLAEAELAAERARVVEQEEARCEVTSDFADVANWLLTCNWHLPGFVHDRISKLKQRLLAAPGSSEQAAPAQHDSSSIRSKAAQEGPGACNRVAPGNAVAPRRGDSGRLRAEQAASSAGDVCGVPYNDDERCCSQRHGHGGQHSFVDGPIEVFWGDPSPAKPELPGGEDFLAEAERCWVGEDNSSALWAVICHLRALEAK